MRIFTATAVPCYGTQQSLERESLGQEEMPQMGETPVTCFVLTPLAQSTSRFTAWARTSIPNNNIGNLRRISLAYAALKIRQPTASNSVTYKHKTKEDFSGFVFHTYFFKLRFQH